MRFTKQIKAIGKSEVCLDEDLLESLPNLPAISGDEDIFTITWANAKRYLDSEVEYLVKGLHLIEEKYKFFSNSDFGFGSTSPSFKVISKLKLEDPILAEELIDWISENGGNYYIETPRGRDAKNLSIFVNS